MTRPPRTRQISLIEAAREGVGAVRTHPLRALLAGIAIAAAVATIAIVVVALDGISRFARTNAARAFGIAFQLDAETVDLYRRAGIDLEEASGETHHGLPVPSVFVVDADGVIRFTHSNPDYKVRLAPEKLLAALDAVTGP